MSPAAVREMRIMKNLSQYEINKREYEDKRRKDVFLAKKERARTILESYKKMCEQEAKLLPPIVRKPKPDPTNISYSTFKRPQSEPVGNKDKPPETYVEFMRAN